MILYQGSKLLKQNELYQHSFLHLENAVSLTNERDLSLLEKQGLLKLYELTCQLAWETIKSFLSENTTNKKTMHCSPIHGAKEAGAITCERLWAEMMHNKHLGDLCYKDEIVESLYEKVTNIYFHELSNLKIFLQKRVI